MNFFHLSDLHIGLKLHERNLTEDHRYVFQQIIDLAKERKPDAIVIAGDIYDKAVPQAEAVQLFDEFLNGLRCAGPQADIMMISGNHDSAPRINLYRQVLSELKVHMVGLPPQHKGETIEKVTREDDYGVVNFYLLPFVKPSMVREITSEERKKGEEKGDKNPSYDEVLHMLIAREHINTQERNVLVSHQFYLPRGTSAETVERADSEIQTVGNIDVVNADVLSLFDYAALGHIHKPMTLGDERYRYCGTPLACSVSEAGQKKGIIEVEMGPKGTVKTTTLPLKPLHEVRVVKGTLEEVLKEAGDDYVSVVLTDTKDYDAMDLQDRIRLAFPNLLEIRREVSFSSRAFQQGEKQEEMDPLSLCCSFIGGFDLDDEEQEEDRKLLQDVILTVQEAT